MSIHGKNSMNMKSKKSGEYKIEEIKEIMFFNLFVDRVKFL